MLLLNYLISRCSFLFGGVGWCACMRMPYWPIYPATGKDWAIWLVSAWLPGSGSWLLLAVACPDLPMLSNCTTHAIPLSQPVVRMLSPCTTHAIPLYQPVVRMLSHCIGQYFTCYPSQSVHAILATRTKGAFSHYSSQTFQSPV